MTERIAKIVAYAKWLKKTLIGLVGVIAFALSTNVIPEGWVAVANGVIAVAAVFGIYKADNAEKPA